jgi:Co/Zn/Cd efflux system component
MFFFIYVKGLRVSLLIVYFNVTVGDPIIGWLIDLLCFSATFNIISAILWRPVLVVEEAGVPGENHRPWASN